MVEEAGELRRTWEASSLDPQHDDIVASCGEEEKPTSESSDAEEEEESPQPWECDWVEDGGNFDAAMMDGDGGESNTQSTYI